MGGTNIRRSGATRAIQKRRASATEKMAEVRNAALERECSLLPRGTQRPRPRECHLPPLRPASALRSLRSDSRP